MALATPAQAQTFVGELVGVAMGFIDDDRQEAFLVEIEKRCGEPES